MVVGNSDSQVILIGIGTVILHGIVGNAGSLGNIGIRKDWHIVGIEQVPKVILVGTVLLVLLV